MSRKMWSADGIIHSWTQPTPPDSGICFHKPSGDPVHLKDLDVKAKLPGWGLEVQPRHHEPRIRCRAPCVLLLICQVAVRVVLAFLSTEWIYTYRVSGAVPGM